MSTATDVRINASFVAQYERLALAALVCRLPRWVTPDSLTWLGVAGACIVIAGGALSWQSVWWLLLANVGLVIHWFGDSLDGTLARFRKIERPRYGFYLDQAIDALGNVLIAVGVGIAPWTRMDTALLVAATYQMLSIQVYVRAIVDREFHMAVGRLGPTEMRLGIFAMNFGIMIFGAPVLFIRPVTLSLWDVLGLVTAAGLVLLFGFQMRGHLRRLAKEDPARCG